MQMPEPAGGTLDWQIEQYGPNGPLPHPGRGPFFGVRAAAGVQSIFCETMGKNIRVHTEALVLLYAQNGGRSAVVKKITAVLYSAKAAKLREKAAILRAIRHFYPQIRRIFAQSASADLAATLF